MSIMQRLTLIGLYNYDSTLFDGLVLPEQYDKNTFVESLMIEHGEKLVLYSDHDFMKYSIAAWGRKWSLELTRIAEAMFAEYNPIWNYDRYEEWNDSGNKRGSSETGASHSEKSLTNSNNNSETSTTDSRVETSSSKTDASHIENGNASKNSDVLTEVEESRRSQAATNDSKTTNAESDSSRRLQNEPDYKEEKVTENVTNGETEHQVSADNSGTYQPESKDITNIGKNKVTTTADGLKDDISEVNRADTVTTENGEVTSEESGLNNSTTTNSGVETSSNEVSGRNNESTSGESSARNTGSITSTGGASSDSSVAGGSNSKTEESQVNNSDHVGHIWGNVGVTTSTHMVTEVIEQRMKYNLYNVACRLFANELLIGIY